MKIKSPHSPVFTMFKREKKKWSLRDIMAQKHEREMLSDVAQEGRCNIRKIFGLETKDRYAVVRRAKGGFHCVGVGHIEAKNFAEVKGFLKDYRSPEGKKFTKIKMGAITAIIQ